MNKRTRARADQWYLILAAIFISSLVACNLIFLKFFSVGPIPWDVIGLEDAGFFSHFEQSVGLLPYPITFLVTDLISEIYGRKKADRVVIAGLVASVFVTGLVLLADALPAASVSPVNEETFSQVFGLNQWGVLASMTAYLTAQFIDIRIFHFWKRLTNGKHLWLRNNGSTIASQLVDTFMVLFVLCTAGAIPWDLFMAFFIQGFLFKMLVALVDTPFLYAFTWIFRKQFNLKMGQELNY